MRRKYDTSTLACFNRLGKRKKYEAGMYRLVKYAINLSTLVFEEITMICFQVMLGKYEEICNKLIKTKSL